ncbi:HNH endonuclease signature motif containing protein [Rhodococcus sp. NPDC060176]|uniref:HNH endonuclease signature motif containing protein n=1 Tax=Rhodococcus sp. NPDC060176 TaxID=3347062 RepID=UPI003658B9BE
MNDEVVENMTDFSDSVTRSDEDKYERDLPYTVDHKNCWIFALGSRDKGGYGVVKIGGRNWYAHRYQYEKHNGPVPEGMEVRHICKNQRDCVNPNHLTVGTHAQNMADIKEHKKSLCSVGHELNRQNSYWFAGTLICKICKAQKLAASKSE